MKALLSTQPGGPETLEWKDITPLSPGPEEVVIAVRAAGVNFPDTLIIRDLYQFKPPRPFAPGAEIAGIVESVGAKVHHLKVGARVAALVGAFGGYATHVCCNASAVVPIADALPFEQAAGFIMTYGTSYYALQDRANLVAGETLLVLGASGGIGSAAIALGKAMGARVVAAVSGEEKAEFCRSIGADDVIVYPAKLDKDTQKTLSRTMKDACGGGADVVLDPVGGDYAEPALRALNWDGRFLVVGFPAGIPSLPLNLTLLKNSKVIGVFWGSAMMRDPALHAANMAYLLEMMADGKMKPVVTKTYPMANGAAALRDIENRTATGKIVLTIDGHNV